MTPTTLPDIKGRCHIDSITGCWLWRGATSPSNGGLTLQPRIHATCYTTDPTGATKKTQTGNRAAWHTANQKPLPKGWRVFKADCCTNGLCINPEHLKAGTTKQWGQSVARNGNWKNVPSRIAANRASGRRNAALTNEQLREVQLSSETGLALAARMGVSPQLISRHRRQKTAASRAVNYWGGLL